MARIFISYSRVDGRFVEALANKLRRIYGHDNVWFDEGLHGGDIWWEEILDQIADRDIFIYVLSNESVQSAYCQAEFSEARRLQKRIITVQARDRTQLTEDLRDIHYINMANGVDDADALTDLYRSINKQLTKVSQHPSKPLWEPRIPNPGKVTEKPRPDDAPIVETPPLEITPAERENVPQLPQKPRRYKPEYIIGIILFMLSVVSVVVILILKPSLLGLNNISLVTSNGEWTPVERDFDGVTMVLVPAGCFEMGSEDGQSDTLSGETICVNEQFWIDKYEVTNAQYGSIGESFCQSSSQSQLPRNCVNWFEARDFCESRDARLPSEVEWEYAARGPDNLIYPWGNDWNPANFNWPYTSNEIFNVGSFFAGASWVGALDMTGNVWEWTSSLSDTTNNFQVARGGMFIFTSFDEESYIPRSHRRGEYDPLYTASYGGFRCARSY